MSLPLKYLIFLLLPIIFLLQPTTAAKFDEDQNVLILRHHNFDKALKSYSHLLILFHTPWCLQCQSAIPEFQKAATSLRSFGSKITLATVDCKLEKELMAQNNITTYPTYKFFVSGKPYPYKGGRNEHQIINWVLKSTTHPCVPITHFQQLESFVLNNDLTVIFWGDQNSLDFKTFEAVSRDLADYPYLYTGSQELKERFGNIGAKVTSIRKLNESAIHFIEAEFSQKKLKTFVKNNRFPLVLEFSDKYAKRVFQDKTPILLLLTHEETSNDELFRVLRKTAEAKKKMLTGFVYLETEWGKRISEAFGSPMIKLPALLILRPTRNSQTEKYLLKGEISEKAALNFVEKFETNKLEIYYKSEPVVPPNDEPVKILVGNNYNHVVKDQMKDVFALLGTPWCKHCQATEPLFTKLAELLQPIQQELMLVKMNAFLNEAEGLYVRSTPTLLFYPMNNKGNPVRFEGERTLKGLWNWLQNHTNLDIHQDLVKEINQFIKNYKEPIRQTAQTSQRSRNDEIYSSAQLQGVQLPMSHSDRKRHGIDQPIGVVPIQGVSADGAISRGVEISPEEQRADWINKENRVQIDDL